MSEGHAGQGTDRSKFLGRAVVGAGALTGVERIEGAAPWGFAAAKSSGPTGR